MINATEGLEIGLFCRNVFFLCAWCVMDDYWHNELTSAFPDLCLPGPKSYKFRSSFSRGYLNKITLTVEKQFVLQGEIN